VGGGGVSGKAGIWRKWLEMGVLAAAVDGLGLNDEGAGFHRGDCRL
jgi:hypothetical protein